MKTRNKMHYLIRKNSYNNYFLYDIQIFAEYGSDKKYYSQVLRFEMQSNAPENFLRCYGFKINDLNLSYLNDATKILEKISGFLYSNNAAKNLISAFDKMKIKKIYPNEVFN